MAGGKGIRLDSVTKRYGDNAVVRDVSLEVTPGEFLSLLGPSGCGKTTTLRIIAGFVAQTSGRILIGESDITEFPAHKRGVSLVFQNYALWPHMTVHQNIAFGLKLRRLERQLIQKKVDEVLAITNLTGFEQRYPRELSGGQQQRVAVSRALALDPSVLLMDEPLSNLDRMLRVEMRKELKQLQARLGVTTLYVTHDQEEALSMSDRVAIMNEGRVLRVATPKEIYDDPQSEFVAAFVGNVNLIGGKIVKSSANETVFESSNGLVLVIEPGSNESAGEVVRIMVRPERIVLSRREIEQPNLMRGRLAFAEYFGATVKYHVELTCGGQITVQSQGTESNGFTVGEEVFLKIDPRHIGVVH